MYIVDCDIIITAVAFSEWLDISELWIIFGSGKNTPRYPGARHLLPTIPLSVLVAASRAVHHTFTRSPSSDSLCSCRVKGVGEPLSTMLSSISSPMAFVPSIVCSRPPPVSMSTSNGTCSKLISSGSSQSLLTGVSLIHGYPSI